MSIAAAVFYLLAALTLFSALAVALSRNIVHSAFALMGTFVGMAGLYVFLGADFLGAVQVLVYVGGILVLTLFAVMLTHRIGDVRVSNRAVGRGLGLVAAGVLAALLLAAVQRGGWAVRTPPAPVPTTYAIGNAFLSRYVLPFEIASVVLLAALVGAVVLTRKEVKD